MIIKVLDSSTGRPLSDARVTLRFANAPESKVETDKGGIARPTIPSAPGPTTLVVQRQAFQREQRSVTAENLANGLSVKMMPVNGWYFVQRVLEMPADLLRLIPNIGSFLESFRVLGQPAAWVARKPRHIRMGATALILVVLWALHDFNLSPFSKTYHNVIDKLGFPSLWDGPRTLKAYYCEGRMKRLGSGAVTIDRTVVIPSGATLIICPNTTLRFHESVGLQVYGTIRAEGNKKEPIIFKACSTDESKIGWAGIFLGEESIAFLSHSHFKMGKGFAYGQFSPEPGEPPRFLSERSPDRTRGGALFVFRSKECNISNCEFDACRAAMGGAVYFRETKDARIRSTSFVNNVADAEGKKKEAGGGAVCLWKASARFENCTFTKNTAPAEHGCGGAIYIASRSVPYFHNCTFSSNRARRQGGAIYANHTLKGQALGGEIQRTEIYDCTFENNSAGYTASFDKPIFVPPTSLQITDRYEGGAIAFVGLVSPFISGCKFSDNIGYEGGALFVGPFAKDKGFEKAICSTFRIDKNFFCGNRSSEHHDGSDLLFSSRGKNNVRDNTFCETEQDQSARILIYSLGEVDRQALHDTMREGNKGLQEKDVEVGYSLLPNVPYCKQPDLRSCQSAVLLMALRYLKPRSSEIFPTVESIYETLNTLGGAVTHKAREAFLNEYLPQHYPELPQSESTWLPRYETHSNKAWAEIVKSIRAGVPVVLSTNFTKSGHVVMVVGYEIGSNGIRQLIVHDPFGAFDFASDPPVWKPDESGREIVYPFEKLSTKIEYRLFHKAGETSVEFRRLPEDKTQTRGKPVANPAEVIKKYGLNDNNLVQETDWEYFILKRFTISGEQKIGLPRFD